MTLDDFAAVNRRATESIETLLRAWFPAGVVEGAEFCIGSSSGEAGKSMRIRLHGEKAGVWADFSSDDAVGADLISLYAHIHCVSQGKACAALAEQVGVQLTQSPSSHFHGKPAPPQAGRVARPNPAPAQAHKGVESPARPAKVPWQPVLPVPADAGPYPKAHPVRGKPDMFWEYKRYHADGTSHLLGVVYRFTTSDGGKEVLPCVWATHPNKGAEWHWMQFPEPRPLYWLNAPRPELPVVVVEGEKCVKAGGTMLAADYDVCSWPGGGTAVAKSDWAEIAGRHVILFADADAKKYKPDHPRAGQLLPEAEQPGMKAMLKLAAILVELGCTVQLVDIPPPGEMPDGWDIADLISSGTSHADVLGWISKLRDPISKPRPTVARIERAWEKADAEEAVKVNTVHTSAPAAPSVERPPMPLPLPDASASTPRAASAGGGKKALRMSLIPTANGGIKSCRENVYLIMQGDPKLLGLVGLDLFADKLTKRRNPPWQSEKGEWLESDDFELGLYIGQNYGFVLATGDIERGVAQAARAHAYNPVTDYIKECARRWQSEAAPDPIPRVEKAFTTYWGAEDSEYTRLISTMFFTGIVMRAFKPGVKHDHAPVFEGGQGLHKSSALKVLGGEWFADTPFRMGDKDGYLSIQGVLVYEIAELEQFNKSEVTAIKAFMSSQVDRYREPYGRRMKDKPRKTAFAATTNEDQYFKDTTGNRRFWPIEIGRFIDLEALARDRDMLFGEAYWMLQGGVKWWPTRDQEERLIRPKQESREIPDLWLTPIRNYCEGIDMDGKPTTAAKKNWVTPSELMVRALHSDLSRLGPAKAESMRISTIMKKLGWIKDRDTAGMRERGYARPGYEKGGKFAKDESQDGGAGEVGHVQPE